MLRYEVTNNSSLVHYKSCYHFAIEWKLQSNPWCHQSQSFEKLSIYEQIALICIWNCIKFYVQLTEKHFAGISMQRTKCESQNAVAPPPQARSRLHWLFHNCFLFHFTLFLKQFFLNKQKVQRPIVCQRWINSANMK